MKKIFLLLGFWGLLAVWAFAETPDQVFPVDFIVQEKSRVNVSFVGVVPFDLSREKIRSTLIYYTRKGLGFSSEGQTFSLKLTPDLELACIRCVEKILLGTSFFDGQKIRLSFGVPSDVDLNKMNSPKSRKALQELFPGFNPPLLHRPSRNEFDRGKKILILYNRFYQDFFGHGSKIQYDQKLLFGRIAKEIGMSVESVENIYDFTTRYFGLGWGYEEIFL